MRNTRSQSRPVSPALHIAAMEVSTSSSLPAANISTSTLPVPASSGSSANMSSSASSSLPVLASTRLTNTSTTLAAAAAPPHVTVSASSVLDPADSDLDQEQEQDHQSEETSSSSSAVINSNQVPTTAVPTDVLVQLLTRLSNNPVTAATNTDVGMRRSATAIAVRHPDKFSGLDRAKLRPFLSQCRMVFMANPLAYDSERAKVMYTASYLDAVALSWFETYIFMNESDPDYPHFMDNYSLFEKELVTLFGDPDAAATAEHKLHQLKMKENHQVARYITDFRRYQAMVNWDDRALQYCFRRGLPSRILDELARREEKPATLLELEQAALKIDLRFWERQQERRDFGDSHKMMEVNKNIRFNRPSSSPSAPLIQSRTETHSNVTEMTQPQFKKLTPEEKQHRIDNKLCLYCGKAGHSAKDCPRSRTNKAEGQRMHKTSGTSVSAQTNNISKSTLKSATVSVLPEKSDSEATIGANAVASPLQNQQNY